MPLQAFGFFLCKISKEIICKVKLLNIRKSWKTVAICLILSFKLYSMGYDKK